MDSLIKYIPGFRSRTRWKMTIASLYYFSAILGLWSGVANMMFYLSLPFIVFGIIDLFMYKKRGIALKTVAMVLGISILVFGFSAVVMPETISDTKDETEVTDNTSSQTTQPSLVEITEPNENETTSVASNEPPVESEKPTPIVTPEPKPEPTPEPKPEPTKAPQASGVMEVHFINVGQGDAIYIKAPNQNILIDGGNRGNTVLDYLKTKGVNQIDLMIGTHLHADHIGGLINVLGGIAVKEVMDPGIAHTSSTFEEYLTLIDEKDITFTEARPGITRNIGGGASLQVLSPQNPSSRHLNDASIVVRVTFGSISFMLAGDAEQSAERDILSRGYDLKSTILKVGHQVFLARNIK